MTPTAKSLDGAYARAVECVTRNMPTTADVNAPTLVSIDAVCAWAVGAAIRYLRDEHEPNVVTPHSDNRNHTHAIQTPPLKQASGYQRKLVVPRAVRIEQAKTSGYTGDMCRQCSNFTMTRNGTCLKCNTCGASDGCS